MTRHQKISLILFAAASFLIVLRIYTLYFPMRLFDYIVPPGQDPANHVLIIQNIMSGKWSLSYPPLFHGFIALVSSLFNLDPLGVLRSVTPLLTILPSIGVYIFLSKTVSRFSAFIAFVIALIASNYGLVAFGDGNYPNIIAAGFLTPVIFAYMINAFRKKVKPNLLYMLLFLLLLILTHHLTTAIFLFVTVVYLIVLAIWNSFEPIVPRLRKVFIAFFCSSPFNC